MVVGGRGEEGRQKVLNVFCVCVELGDWASEKLSGRVQLEGHSTKRRVLRDFSFQPYEPHICVNSNILKAKIVSYLGCLGQEIVQL